MVDVPAVDLHLAHLVCQRDALAEAFQTYPHGQGQNLLGVAHGGVKDHLAVHHHQGCAVPLRHQLEVSPVIQLLFDQGHLVIFEGADGDAPGKARRHRLVQNALDDLCRLALAGVKGLATAHQIAQPIDAADLDAGRALRRKFHGVVVYIAVKDFFFFDIAGFDGQLRSHLNQACDLAVPAALLVVIQPFDGKAAPPGSAVGVQFHFQLGDGSFGTGQLFAAQSDFERRR